MGGTKKNQGGSAPSVAGLLRRPAVVVRHRILDALEDAGFGDVLPAHLGVFQYPGPEGQRPGVLAVRTQASKQAMNHLLHQLEEQGYLHRETHPHDRRTRVIRLTERGHAAAAVIQTTVEAVDAEWKAVLGAEAYAAMRAGLLRLESHLDLVDRLDHHGL